MCWISFGLYLLFLLTMVVYYAFAWLLQTGWVFYIVTTGQVSQKITESSCKGLLYQTKLHCCGKIIFFFASLLTVIGIQLLSYAISFFRTTKKPDLSRWHLNCVLTRHNATSNLSLHNENGTAVRLDTLTSQ